jgi:hypothetical protein
VTRARQSHTHSSGCSFHKIAQCNAHYLREVENKKRMSFHPVLHPQLDVLSCSTSTPTGDGVD